MAGGAASNRFQTMLQEAVQSVQWTYSLFWQLCPQQGILIWGDGYYNGAIKTRKTVQPMEVSAEEASLQRSQQLRELYDSLSAGETNQPTRRPCASLSPEDLTESEWFYLMCVSFSFPPGVGLPGKAYTRRQHVWLTGANEVDSKTFSRAILAKSARIQTVVCIPVLDGVLELGTVDRVEEDAGMIQQIKSLFTGQHPTNLAVPKPALSEHSTSNPATSSEHRRFHSPPIPAIYAAVDPRPDNPTDHQEEDYEEEEDEDEEEEEEENSEAEARTKRTAVVEPSELMQLEMSEDIRVGSPDDASNNLESDFHLLAVNPDEHQRRVELLRAESSRRWQMLQQEPPAPPPPSSGIEELTQEDSHYSQTVSSILQKQATRWAESTSAGHVSYSTQSCFTKWTNRSDVVHVQIPIESSSSASQWILKYILFSVPFLHNKYRDENSSPKSRDAASKFRKGTPQEELSANHVLAERRRREKLNERFIILRSLVPFVTKMDKASILGDTIEYVKQLRKKIQDLETRNKQMEADQRSRLSDSPRSVSGLKEPRSGLSVADRSRVGPDKKKMRIVEAKTVGSPPPPPPLLPPPTNTATAVQVSIIESDALVELQCGYREGLLLDVMQMLRELLIEVTSVQSSLTNDCFSAQLRAKVKDNASGKKASIVEVKRAIHQLIPQY